MQSHDRQLRVAILLPNLQIGGAQEVARTLAKHLASDRCTPIVCALFADGPLLHDLAQQGSQVKVLYLSRRSVLALPWFLADLIRMWRALWHFMLEHKINIIQTNILGSNSFLVLALAKAMKIPVVTFTFHSQRFLPTTEGRSLKNRLYCLAYRLARHWTSDYVAVSNEIKQAMVRLLGLGEGKITAIGNGVDIDRYRQPTDRERLRRQLGLPPQAPVLITVGTLRTAKGHRYLIQAAADVLRRFPETHFLFVGDGELRHPLESQTAACGLTEKIHFLGSRQDIPDLLAASDVFVLPSLWEGLSMALLEAMAAAKPIVATAVSGTSQVIIDKENGILTPPGDAPALAQAICDVLSQLDAGACAMGESARRRVAASFSVEKQAAEYMALYERLLHTHARRRWGDV
ncbi:MAG: glycosyltransferase [Caldilineaceae bacterium]|nr:glycosyltransferase [Caldilineaceae bacterium]